MHIGIIESACNFGCVNIATVRQGNNNILGKSVGSLTIRNNCSRLFRFYSKIRQSRIQDLSKLHLRDYH